MLVQRHRLGATQAVIFRLEDVLIDAAALLIRPAQPASGPYTGSDSHVGQRDLLHALRRLDHRIGSISRYPQSEQGFLLKRAGLVHLVDRTTDECYEEETATCIRRLAASLQVAMAGICVVVCTPEDEAQARAIGVMRVLRVAGPSEVNVQLLPHLSDREDCTHAA